MICTFCGDPAASEATGCRYGPRTLACYACTVAFWRWALGHINGKGGRIAKRWPGIRSFYECAGDHLRKGVLP